MAIKIQNNTVISDSLDASVQKVAFADGTVASFTGNPATSFSTTSFSGVEKITQSRLSSSVGSVRSSTSQLLQTINNPNAYSTSTSDKFGYSIDTSGDYLVVGVPDEDDAGGLGSGKVYVYNMATGQLLNTINNSNVYSTTAGDSFGYSVAIDGSTIIIGAPNEDYWRGNQAGAVYIASVSGGASAITTPDTAGDPTDYFFGAAVDISGDKFIVGAYGYDNENNNNLHGRAYIYNTSGTLLYTLALSGTSASKFGYSVAIDGDYAIVGAPGGNLARIYNASTGALLWILSNPNIDTTTASDNFGAAVAISQNYAVVSATLEEFNNINSGIVYVYDVTTGERIRTINTPNQSIEYGVGFGSSVEIRENILIIGSSGEASGAGRTYIYDISTSSFIQTIENPNTYSTAASDNFGSSVSITDKYYVSAAKNEDDASGSDSGKVYVYLRSNFYNLNVENTTVQDKLLTLFS